MSTQSEEKAFTEFKDKVKPYLDDTRFLHQDFYLKKWLTARDFNVKKAEKMFLDNVEFRKRFDVDNIREEYIPNDILKKYTTGGLIGYDKEGNVLRVELFGMLDMKGIMYSCKKSDLERMKILECEQVVQMWKEREHEGTHQTRSDGMTVIFDMAGVTSSVLWRPGLTMYLHLIKLLEDNYPEMLKRLLVINAPSIFPFLWTICKPLMSEHTKRKIHILKAPYDDELLKYISASVLPKCFGGDRTDDDGDSRCKNIINQGGTVPVELYNTDMVNVTDAETVTIGHGGEYVIKMEVTKIHSILRWEFKTSSFDLGFGLSFENELHEKKFLIPISRVNCHLVPEDGTFECQEMGTYSLIFDNSYSMTRSKVVDIFCELLDQDESYENEIAPT